MNILEITIDENRNITMNNSEDCMVGDLFALVCTLLIVVANQTKRSTEMLLKDLAVMLSDKK